MLDLYNNTVAGTTYYARVRAIDAQYGFAGSYTAESSVISVGMRLSAWHCKCKTLHSSSYVEIVGLDFWGLIQVLGFKSVHLYSWV